MDREDLKTALIVIPAVAVMATAGFYLWRDYKAPREELEDEVERDPIATMTVTQNNVKRKTFESAYWNGVGKAEVLFDKDSVRTGPDSTAIIKMNDNSIIELNENSLVVLERGSGRVSVDLKVGDLSAKNSSANLDVKVNDRVLRTQGAEVQLKNDAKKNTEIIVTKGAATLVDKTNNQAIELSKEKSVKIDSAGKAQTNILAVQLLSPATNTTYLAPEPSVEKPFTWEALIPTLKEEYFEISNNHDFSGDGVLRRKAHQAITAPIKRGTSYWRVGWKDSTGQFRYTETRTIKLEEDIHIRLTRPANAASFELPPQENTIDLLWNTDLRPERFLLEIATLPDFSKIKESAATKELKYQVKNLPSGTYYWRVRAYDNTNHEIARSSPYHFTCNLIIPSFPQLKSPKNGFIWKLAEPLYLEWLPYQPADKYRLLITKDAQRRQTVHSIVQNKTSYLWQWTKPGEYYWGVEALDAQNSLIGESLINKMEITLPHSGLAIVLTNPKDQTLVLRERKDPMDPINFEWKSDKTLEGNYTLTVANNSEFTNSKKWEHISTTSSLATLSQSGTYYWKVQWINPTNPKDVLESQTQAFQLKVTTSLPAPELIEPLHEAKLYTLHADPVVMKWNPVPQADKYRLRIDRYDPKTKQNIPVSNQIVKTTETPSSSLPTGIYRWNVMALDKNNIEGHVSETRTLLILTQKELEAPKIKPAVIK